MKTVEFRGRDVIGMREEAVKAFPVEACGLLFGERKDEKFLVRRVQITKNKLGSTVRFEVDAQEFYNALKKAEEESMELLGFFHSHHAKPEPSQIDLQSMRLWEGYVWLIFSTMDYSMKAYLMDEGEVEELKVKVLSDR
ncbi:M67 family metallopeptidase [Candidatus Bathyarchaeota archaeon]|nr:M67 family metallopeptidase [Candidatus Bathyarchaeota archaeon]